MVSSPAKGIPELRFNVTLLKERDCVSGRLEQPVSYSHHTVSVVRLAVFCRNKSVKRAVEKSPCKCKLPVFRDGSSEQD